MTSREVASAYDKLADTYDRLHVGPRSLAENRYVASLLRRTIGESDRVVDLGCGTGLLLELMPVAPANYLGVDISAGMLERAKEKHPEHRFLVGDIQSPGPGLEEGAADLAISLFGSASYCDLGPLRDQVMRLLRPRGRYLIMFCGPRYPERDTYVNKANPLIHGYTAAQIARTFAPDSVRGMSLSLDLAPEWLPGRMLDLVNRVDVSFLGRLLPNACYFLIASGSRRM